MRWPGTSAREHARKMRIVTLWLWYRDVLRAAWGLGNSARRSGACLMRDAHRAGQTSRGVERDEDANCRGSGERGGGDGAAISAAAGDLSLSNKWRVECSEGANSDGTILFRVTPRAARRPRSPCRSRTGAARTVWRVTSAMRSATRSTEAVPQRDRRRRGRAAEEEGRAPNFELKLVSSTVKSVRFDIEKE